MSNKAMKLALEALKDNQHLIADNERHAYVMAYNAIIEKLEEALAKQEQDEPVAKYGGECWEGSLLQLYDDVKKGTYFYTKPQQRTWVGLTDEEVVQCQQGNIYHFYRCIEAKLKEKNT